MSLLFLLSFFFFNDTATTEIYTLSLHDALPILQLFLAVAHDLLPGLSVRYREDTEPRAAGRSERKVFLDRKSTRLNSSHLVISYAVFCLKKKNSMMSHHSLTIPSLSHVHPRTLL